MVIIHCFIPNLTLVGISINDFNSSIDFNVADAVGSAVSFPALHHY